MAYEDQQISGIQTGGCRDAAWDCQYGCSHFDLVLCTILRAGLPLHYGLLEYFDGQCIYCRL